jgi:prevent-host-death family protein
MHSINIHEAKTQLSRLVEEAAAGEAFIIAKAGKPMVKVVPLSAADLPGGNRIGFMAGEVSVPEDFDTMGSSDIAAMFEA